MFIEETLSLVNPKALEFIFDQSLNWCSLNSVIFIINIDFVTIFKVS